MRYQPIYDIAEICVRKGIQHVVLCPGSRCAPLTLAFTRHPDITTHTFSDERSAGFVALGMAQSLRRPVAIVCTSGTAVYSLAPAVAEAHFSKTPLVVITADRPAEWIAQHDGQTIYQAEIFGKHVKKYFSLPQDYDHYDSVWAINRMINDALNFAVQAPRGPVHINAPFREPLYPAKGEDTIRYSDVRIVHEYLPADELSPAMKERIKQDWPGFTKVLLVSGQHVADQHLLSAIEIFREKHHLAIVHDVISNLHEVGDGISHSDLFLGQAPEDYKRSLQPDLLITFGESLISKNLKLFLRRYPARKHWHIQGQGPVADTLQSVTDVFFTSPASFFAFLNSIDARSSTGLESQKIYTARWRAEEIRVRAVLQDFFEGEALHELALVRRLMMHLPAHSNLHLANSMSVRYANFIGLEPAPKGIEVFANRGTSGIDGSTSTAVGHTLLSNKPNFLITGDLAFFYDRNAFWHNYPIPDLRVLLLNNHGGLIFDVLDGPSSTPEAREYFITRQGLNARAVCDEYGFVHLKVSSGQETDEVLEEFLTFDQRPKLLELEGDTTTNKKVFERLKSQIKKSYEL